MNENAYQFNFSQLDGEEISLSQFKGKAILIVNTASEYNIFIFIPILFY